MNLLLFLRCCTGEFDAWPSIIFELIFIDEPHSAAIREVSAFFHNVTLITFMFYVTNGQAFLKHTQCLLIILFGMKKNKHFITQNIIIPNPKKLCGSMDETTLNWSLSYLKMNQICRWEWTEPTMLIKFVTRCIVCGIEKLFLNYCTNACIQVYKKTNKQMELLFFSFF